MNSHNESVSVAFDAMGGDFGIDTTLAAARMATADGTLRCLFVGDRAQIEAAFARHGVSEKERERIEVVHAAETVGMDEHPGEALKQKRNSSLAVGFQLVRSGRANGFVSAGNSGAVMAFALAGLGRIKGINRPAIACCFPTPVGHSVLIDAGANTVCKPINLYQFAVMGALYAELILGVTRPKVGVISNGSERSKGNALTQEADGLLRKSAIDYVGYVEGRDIMAGQIRVCVCDGFVGNVILKSCEGFGSTLVTMLKSTLAKRWSWKLGLWLARGGFRELFRSFDPNQYGGAPLLGVDGVTIIAHGASTPTALKNALFVARDFAKKKWLEKLKGCIDKVDANGGEDVLSPEA